MAPRAEDTEDNLSASSEEDSEEEDLQGQISEIPFEELQKARSDGSSSFRPFPSQKSIPKRANKNRPVEMSSKKPVSRFREVVQAPKRVVRDPRFESLCGNYEESKFKTSYKFLYDEELPAERKRLQELLQKGKAGAASEETQKHINWIILRYAIRHLHLQKKCGWSLKAYSANLINSKVVLNQRCYDFKMNDEDELTEHLSNVGSITTQLNDLGMVVGDEDKAMVLLKTIKKDTQLKEEQLRRKRSQKSSEQRQKEREAVKQGKKPFYTKKSETRKQELVAKYKELKASGKLEAFLAKRRRKNAAKDHRYMPYRRPPAA